MTRSPLDYEPRSFPGGSRAQWAGLGFVLGVFALFPTLAAALWSAGGGGHRYIVAMALFPLPSLIVRIPMREVSAWSLPLLLLQYPLYGAFLGWKCADRRGVDRRAVVGVVLVHSIAFITGMFFR